MKKKEEEDEKGDERENERFDSEKRSFERTEMKWIDTEKRVKKKTVDK